jgi:hypothetical protein
MLFASHLGSMAASRSIDNERPSRSMMPIRESVESRSRSRWVLMRWRFRRGGKRRAAPLPRAARGSLAQQLGMNAIVDGKRAIRTRVWSGSNVAGPMSTASATGSVLKSRGTPADIEAMRQLSSVHAGERAAVDGGIFAEDVAAPSPKAHADLH